MTFSESRYCLTTLGGPVVLAVVDAIGVVGVGVVISEPSPAVVEDGVLASNCMVEGASIFILRCMQLK